MSKQVIVLFFLILVWTLPAHAMGADWQVKRSDHFVVHFQEAPSEYINQLIKRSEDYYKNITQTFGFTRYDGFWTWDRRANIYLYMTREAYQKATNQPDWSDARANIFSREIHTYINMHEFFDRILPHEIAHLIFREFVGLEWQLPLWIDEGIACWSEKKGMDARFAMAQTLVTSERFISLQKLSQMGPEEITDADAFYSESASVIEFLYRSGGREKLIDYFRCLRDHEDWVFSLKKIYGFQNLSEMNRAWMEFLNGPR
jgi:hypothetical protein